MYNASIGTPLLVSGILLFVIGAIVNILNIVYWSYYIKQQKDDKIIDTDKTKEKTPWISILLLIVATLMMLVGGILIIVYIASKIKVKQSTPKDTTNSTNSSNVDNKIMQLEKEQSTFKNILSSLFGKDKNSITNRLSAIENRLSIVEKK